MNSLAERLASLGNWPKEDTVSGRQLATAGFTYLGQGDTVTCLECNGRLSDWVDGDRPASQHARWFPSCSYIRCQHPVQVRTAMQEERDRLATFPPTWCCAGMNAGGGGTSCSPACCNELAGEGFFHGSDRTVCCVRCLADFEIPSNEDDGWELHAQANHVCEKVIEDMLPPVQHMLKTSGQARLATFANWPLDDVVHPQKLADAGLYYTLRQDVVRCPFCNSGNKDWEEGDEPWEEHAKAFPDCPVVRDYQQFNDTESRCKSFPDDMSMPFDVVKSVAQAGFFYGNKDGLLHCYRCRLVVERFPDGRCPWLEHGDKSPHCPHFLRWAPVDIISDRFCLASARQESFAALSYLSAEISHQLFTESGFFYCYTGDVVRCYGCGQVLCYWDPGDDVWLEHWRHSRHCSLLARKPPGSPSWLSVCLESRITDEELKMVVESSTAFRVLTALQNWPDGAPLTRNILLQQISASRYGPNGHQRAASGYTAQATAPMLPAAPEPPAKRAADADRHACKVCMDNDVAVVFQPCKHMVCCEECSGQVQRCPLCRAAITDKMTVYL
ncbi:baculoviral IAP repeat-containing protein 7-like [Sycon ciliatum]|uniref:baculoviral IAP repeat-containing protein 7-like n=1 Tax=Sycon ciliatum TaxID=27933 RepID=UPI0020AE9018|eukprot:scpid51317/ scgid32468/ Baculoviral IAP repeat-containing protein 3; Inhibitor of apoptosis protein 1